MRDSQIVSKWTTKCSTNEMLYWRLLKENLPLGGPIDHRRNTVFDKGQTEDLIHWTSMADPHYDQLVSSALRWSCFKWEHRPTHLGIVEEAKRLINEIILNESFISRAIIRDILGNAILFYSTMGPLYLIKE